MIITLVNNSGFSPDLVCALILWRSGLGMLMDKIFIKFGQLPACHTVVAEYSRFMCLVFNIKHGLQLMMLECGLLHVCCYAIKYVPTKTGSLNIFG